MNRILSTLLVVSTLLMPSFGCMSFSGRGSGRPVQGFRSMAFGSTYAEVKKYLEREFKDNAVLADEPGSLVLKAFDLGRIKADVVFSFDHVHRFSGFSLVTTMKEQYREEEVVNDHRMLKEIFVNRYGAGVSCRDSIVLFEGVQCVWRDKLLTIATGYKAVGWKYGAYGIVESKKMARDESDYQKKQTKQQDTSTTSPF